MSVEFSKWLEKLVIEADEHNRPTPLLKSLVNEEIVIYGAGELAETFYVRVIERYSLKVKLVIDKTFTELGFFHGIPAHSPSPKLKEVIGSGSTCIITVASKNAQDEITNFLKQFDFKNIVHCVQLYETQLLVSPHGYNKGLKNFYLESMNDIKKVFSLLEDNLSRDIFCKFLLTHISKKNIEFPASPKDEQYFPKDIEMKRGKEVFVNCGAFDGDTLRAFHSIFGFVRTIVCFEPNSENYDRLQKYLDGASLSKEMYVIPCGVYSSNESFRFLKSKASSVISDNGDAMMQCVKIDDILKSFSPTFINMDIEGSEFEALKGAKKIITANKPDLAISVYHNPEHIWTIVLLINSWELGYSFYFRTYTYFSNETVLYATCN